MIILENITGTEGSTTTHLYHTVTVRVTNSGSVLPLYKICQISVLLKTGGAGRFIITRKISVVIIGQLFTEYYVTRKSPK